MKHFYDDNNCLVNVSNSILKHFDIETFHPTLNKLDAVLSKTNKKICLILLDGLGSKIREVYKNECQFINSGYFSTITSVFPPTTVAATTALMSSKYPCETSWLGWSEKFKDTEFDVLMFYSEYNRQSELKVPFNTYFRLPYTSIIKRINDSGKKADLLQSFTLTDDDKFTLFFTEADKKIKENDFTYIYHTQPDSYLHEYGVGSDELKPVIKSLNEGIEQLVKENKDTLFIVLADHGHLNVEYFNIEEHKDFYSLLSYPYISLEARAVSFFVKEGEKEEFRRLGEKYYSEYFYILDKKEVKESHIFGIGKENKYFDEVIGDFLFISKGKAAFFDKDSHKFKSHHAGSTLDEMLINISCFNVD